jgi:hypothetical protein
MKMKDEREADGGSAFLSSFILHHFSGRYLPSAESVMMRASWEGGASP